ncbi:DeoR/GlpR family DNA-binding transcription regulator [Lacisediminihabitans changchengi]|uniref:DeoR/GlpR transcriptional regulator n=1 Tax=Lacisediminihabitans changchengi TaxID=2787634 RepID=A0A934SJ98_9MICO|nr:DeoR/GlpR family DNA-binding transcription regulator [Lacisediminihabitans changchengi]MBK4346301.1 DeoR/GlpR transcriptional regulator [Lacisediminihabitans changchengi]
MLAHQRDEKILDRLRETGSASAQDLMALLNVSGPTIRRDLERLEQEGALQRVHGGAYLAGGAPEAVAEQPFGAVVDQNASVKDAVAAAAAALVTDGQVVLLDIGTTTMRIAHHLRGRKVTVITSSLAILDVLRNDDVVDLVLLGGAVRRNYQTLVGPLTEDALASISADIAFLSCTGVRSDGAVVDDISREASVKRAIVSAANQVVLVAPANKFPGTGSLKICALSEIDVLVTSSGAVEATLAQYTEAGGRVVFA